MKKNSQVKRCFVVIARIGIGSMHCEILRAMLYVYMKTTKLSLLVTLLERRLRIRKHGNEDHLKMEDEAKSERVT